MEIATIVAYVLTLLAVSFSITAIPQAILGGVFGKLGVPLMGMLMGGVISWIAIDALWYFLEGAHLPFTVFVASFLLLAIHGSISKDKLTEQARWMMAGEMWAIVLVGVGAFFLSESFRWY